MSIRPAPIRRRARDIRRKITLLTRLFQGASITASSPKRVISSCFTSGLPGRNSSDSRSRRNEASSGSMVASAGLSATETRMERLEGTGTQPLRWSVDRGLRRMAIMSFGVGPELSGLRQHMREARFECSKNIGRIVEHHQDLVIEVA